ncbi:hypothetical protein [Streptomyces chartreusis]|uniref:hypothetical protein n=1 Tax=Streptomyces chartreusis TaxID=1969 RepID=UPI0033B06792
MPNPHRITEAEIRDAMSGLSYDTASSSTDHALAPLLAVTDADHILYGSDYGAPCTEEAALTHNLDLLMKYERLSTPQREQMGLVAASLFPRAAERIG